MCSDIFIEYFYLPAGWLISERRVRIVVLLPAPLGPRNPKHHHGTHQNWLSSTALKFP